MSTSTPRKLELLRNASERKTSDGATLLNGIDELLAALASDSRFKDYQIELPEDGVCSVTYQGLTAILLSDTLWGNQVKLRPYLTVVGSLGIGLVCVGTEAMLATLPEALRHEEINAIGLPISFAHLDLQLSETFKTLKLLRDLRQEKAQVQEASEHVKYVLSVSRELNGVRDTKKLLSLILTKAREITGADAGSLYTVESPTDNIVDGTIYFKITQNESVTQNLSEFGLPVNDTSIVGNAVLTGKAINIPDLYKLSDNPADNPYGARHDRTWDQRIGYECHSMLTVPMFDISHKVIGVIQLINRKKTKNRRLQSTRDFEEEVIEFDARSIEYAEIVAQQAGIALENALLTEEKEQLFEGFVDASIKAIEQRDPTTSGHSHRVAKITLELAHNIDRITVGPYKNITFKESQFKEIEYASLLHDFGKLGVREQVLVKAKKLYPWQMDLLLERFELIRSRHEIDYLREFVNYLQAPTLYPPGLSPKHFERERDQKHKDLEQFLNFVLKVNEPTVLEQGGFERLKDIANLSFKDSRGNTRPYIKAEELKALSVSRGSLTAEEFAEIQSHVTHTYEFLRKIPWGKDLANVPQIAAKHHEKLDGSGYPTSSPGEEIPVQSRMMTIADIFDALTAADRPYKRAVPIPKALEIIEMEVKGGKCDSELFKIFVETKAYEVALDKNT